MPATAAPPPPAASIDDAAPPDAGPLAPAFNVRPAGTPVGPAPPAPPPTGRHARFAPVAALIESLHATLDGEPVRVLDAGGFDDFWKGLPNDLLARCRVTLLDPGLKKPPRDARDPRFDYRAGDVCDLSRWRTGAFDLAFSQGTLDHLGLYALQERFAAELRRVGRRYVVRAPNFWFPVDPDYRVPLWQYLPARVRVALVRRFQIGQIDRARCEADARRWVEETRLVTAAELRALFPDGEILRERLCGLTKSFCVLGPSKFLGETR